MPLVEAQQQFLNLTEAIEWIRTVLGQFDNDGNIIIDDFLSKKSLIDVKDRILDKIINKEENDEEILDIYLSNLSDEYLAILYYKNNFLEFINDHAIIQSLIIEIFENVENLNYVDEKDKDWFSKIPPEYTKDMVGKTAKDWNNFVNKQYFMDPNNVPESIANQLYELKEYLMKYVYSDYLSPDRIYRLRNFKRKVVTVIDTDSNILSLDTSVNYIMNNIIKGETFNRDFTNNIFICVNMIAYILTAVVTDILLLYGKKSNIPEEFRPIYSMKNELNKFSSCKTSLIAGNSC